MMDSHRLSLIEIIPKFDTVQYSSTALFLQLIVLFLGSLQHCILRFLLLYCYIYVMSLHKPRTSICTQKLHKT